MREATDEEAERDAEKVDGVQLRNNKAEWQENREEVQARGAEGPFSVGREKCLVPETMQEEGRRG